MLHVLDYLLLKQKLQQSVN